MLDCARAKAGQKAKACNQKSEIMNTIMYRLLAVHPLCAEWLLELLIVTMLR